MFAGCSSGEEATGPDEGAVTTTAVEQFSGDPDSEFCGILTRVYNSELPSDAAPEAVKSEVNAVLGITEDFISSAPEELRDESEIAVSGIRELAGELEAVGFDSSAIDTSRVGVFTEKKYTEATEVLRSYRDQVCAPPAEAVEATEGEP